MRLVLCVYIVSILNFLTADYTANFVEFDETETERHFITKCITEISKREIFWKPTVVLKIDNEHATKEASLMDHLVKVLNIEYIPFMTTESVEDLKYTEANYLVAINFEDCNGIVNFNNTVIDNKIKYIIIIQEYFSDNCIQKLQDIGELIEQNEVSVFLKHTKDIYEIYTLKPEIDPSVCKVLVGKPLKINTCYRGKLKNKYVFPLKHVSNYNKCLINVGIASLYPFSNIKNKDSLKTFDHIEETRVNGMDLELIKIIFDHLNVTYDLYYISKLEENALLEMEFIEFVKNGSLEICIGGLYRIYGDAVEYSGVYARQTIVWLYHAERLDKTWQTLIPTVDGLYLFMVFYFCYSAVLYVISMADKNSVSINYVLLIAWGSLVGSTSLLNARTMKLKILNAVYLIMCLHLSVYINIQLYSFFAIQEPPTTYKSNDALMKSGKVPYLQPIAKYFVNDEKYIQFANTSKDCARFEDCAKKSVLHKGMTILIEDFAINVQVQTAVNNEARMLIPSENLLTVYYEMVLKKGHPLVKKFQNVLESLIEAGFTKKLLEEAVGTTIISKADIATRTLLSKSYNCQDGCTLTITQLGGAFYIVIFGCVASTAVFILELLGHSKIETQQ